MKSHYNEKLGVYALGMFRYITLLTMLTGSEKEKKGSPIRRLLSRASAPLTRRSNCFRLCYAKSEHI